LVFNTITETIAKIKPWKRQSLKNAGGQICHIHLKAGVIQRIAKIISQNLFQFFVQYFPIGSFFQILVQGKVADFGPF